MDTKTKNTVRTIATNICAVTALSIGVGVISADADTSTKSEPRGMLSGINADTKESIEKTAAAASTTFSKFTTGAKAQITKAQLDKAKCVVIFPSITNVALVVGGKHGDGVMTCKTAAGYSNVAPVDLSTASLGVQLGANSTELILLLNTEGAKERMSKGTINLGADATVTAFSTDHKAEINTDQSDVLAFSENSGLFAGTALDGTNLKIDIDEIENLYGKRIPVGTLLSTSNDMITTGPVNELLTKISKTI